MNDKERAAMQQALEALEYETNSHKNYNRKPLLSSLEAITALREALAKQAEQEPVASVSLWHNHGYQNRQLEYYGNLPDGLHQLYAAPVQQAEQEPVAITDGMAYAFHSALTDGSIGASEVEEIKTGLRAAFANVAVPPQPKAEQQDGLDTNPLSVFAKECVLGAYMCEELPDAARLALKRAQKAEQDHSGEANEMVATVKDSLTVQDLAHVVTSDPLYQQGFVDGVEEGRNQVAEPNFNAEDVAEAKRLLPIYSRASKFLEIVSGEPQITTPDVCGEVCARAKLCYGCNKDLEEANAKYVEQAEQEPTGHVLSDGTICWDKWCPDAGTLLYAAPVRTKDLTDEEIASIPPHHSNGGYLEFARAVIAADRAKNNLCELTK